MARGVLVVPASACFAEGMFSIFGRIANWQCDGFQFSNISDLTIYKAKLSLHELAPDLNVKMWKAFRYPNYLVRSPRNGNRTDT